MRYAACALWVIASISCGASDGADADDGCDLSITVDTAEPTVGSPVRVSVANLDSSFFTPSWTVRFDGADYPHSTAAGDDRRIDFVPEQPGPYEVVASGTWEGGSCLQARETINATVEGANTVDLRLRLTPPADSGQAPGDRVVRIYGGADYVLGDLDLDAPVAASGIVRVDGDPIAAHIRVTTPTGEPLADGEAGADGVYALTLPEQPVEVAVMPADPTVAPLQMTGVVASSLGDIDLSGAVSITGTVTGPGGAAMTGARVQLRLDGLPSSLAVTDGSGDFAIAARPGTDAVIEVVPPADSGLPIASLALTDIPGAGSAVAVDYASLPVTSQSFEITLADGSTPAPGARLLLAADDIAGVAAVSVDGADQGMAAGRVRRFATADGSGQITGLALTDAVYTAVAEPAAGSPGIPSLATVDTGGAFDVQLADTSIDWLAELGSAGGAVEGAVVRARPLGAIAALSASSATATSDGTGAVSLPLIGGADYAIAIEPPAGLARHRVGELSAPASGTTDAGAIALGATLVVSGRVRAPGGTAVAGVHLAFYCTDCPTPDIPIAEGLTDSGGRFAVELLDPGVAQ